MDEFEREVQLYLTNKKNFLEFSGKAQELGKQLDGLVDEHYRGFKTLSPHLPLHQYSPENLLMLRKDLSVDQKLAIATGAHCSEWQFYLRNHAQQLPLPWEHTTAILNDFTENYFRAKEQFVKKLTNDQSPKENSDKETTTKNK